MHGRESVVSVLDENRRDGYTISSATLYPSAALSLARAADDAQTEGAR